MDTCDSVVRVYSQLAMDLYRIASLPCKDTLLLTRYRLSLTQSSLYLLYLAERALLPEKLTFKMDLHADRVRDTIRKNREKVAKLHKFLWHDLYEILQYDTDVSREIDHAVIANALLFGI